MNISKGLAHRDRSLFIAVSLVVLLYVILRAALVPWIHDESTSLYWYVERGEFLPYRSLWDAGNHYLSSAIALVPYKFWGLSLIGSRTGSMLAFILYACAVLRSGTHVGDRRVRWALWIALLTCPFLLDFFSLFRGYGLAMAFWMIAIDGGLRFFRSNTMVHMIQMFTGLALSNFAVLSLFPLWALIVIGVAVAGVIQWKRTPATHARRKFFIWALFGFLPLMIGLLLVWEMRRRGLLYHGSTEGFADVTISSLCRYVLGSDHPLVILICCVTVLASCGVVLMTRKGITGLAILGALLLADVTMRMGMAEILGVNYPEDRAALYLVPLVIMIIGLAADMIAARWKYLSVLLMMFLLFLPFRSMVVANFDHTLLWPEQSVPTRFLKKIADLQLDAHRPLVIGAYHQLSFSIPYSARVNRSLLQPPDVVGFPTGIHDVRIVDDRFLKAALIGFHEIDRSVGNGTYLLLRDGPVNMQEIEDRRIEQQDEEAEFIELWRDTAAIDRILQAELHARISSNADFLHMFLVVSQSRNDSSVYHQAVPLSHFRTRWSGEELVMRMNLPDVNAGERKVYFWNPDKELVQITDIGIRLYEITGSPTFGSEAER
ncbi:MAG: hypothetical protein M3R08_02670 [Bacteroidota bacterium]|nr:hypothetical protein [Bacteroidota bacterium]